MAGAYHISGLIGAWPYENIESRSPNYHMGAKGRVLAGNCVKGHLWDKSHVRTYRLLQIRPDKEQEALSRGTVSFLLCQLRGGSCQTMVDCSLWPAGPPNKQGANKYFYCIYIMFGVLSNLATISSIWESVNTAPFNMKDLIFTSIFFISKEGLKQIFQNAEE